MIYIKKILKGLLILISIPVIYVIVALILTYIPISESSDSALKNHTIYLRTNGVHLDFVIPVEELNPALSQDLEYGNHVQYLAFGWGDKNFYLETPNWSDLTLKNTLTGLFLITPTLVHVVKLEWKGDTWVRVKLNDDQIEKLQAYITATFQLDTDSKKIILSGKGYNDNDEFYEANGSYTCFKACNSWVNTGLKEAGMKACVWTPFDFGVLRRYQ